MKETLTAILESKQATDLADLFENHYPVDIAEKLEEVSDEDKTTFIQLASDAQLVAILEESSPALQESLMAILPADRVGPIFHLMQNDEVVDLLGLLPDDEQQQLLSEMSIQGSQTIQSMLYYDEDSAGGIMTNEFITLPEQLTLPETIDRLRQISPNTQVIDTLFITNRHHQLIGSMNIRDIFINPQDKQLHDILHEQPITVTADMDQEEVAQLAAKYNLSVVPVVNAHNIMLGIITIDDIVDVLVEEHNEDILRMGGLQDAEQIGDPFFDSLRKRLPWLLINLLTAFLASATVALFDGTITQVVALAAIGPMITGMGGNSASQTLALVIQGIALGKLDLKGDKHFVVKEIALALANGLVTGLVAAIAIFIYYHNIYLAIIVILAMMANLCVGAVFGFFVPLILKSLRQDPALASTIFITTATDVLGYFAFLGLAFLFLPLLT